MFGVYDATFMFTKIVQFFFEINYIRWIRKFTNASNYDFFFNFSNFFNTFIYFYFSCLFKIHVFLINSTNYWAKLNFCKCAQKTKVKRSICKKRIHYNVYNYLCTIRASLYLQITGSIDCVQIENRMKYPCN